VRSDVVIRVGSDSVPTEFLDTTRRRLGVGLRDGTIRLLFEIPRFDPFADTTRVCGGSALLDAGAGYVTYVWDSLNRSRTLPVVRDSLYRVAVVDSLRCRGSDSTYVRLLPIPDGTLSLVGDSLLCEGAARLLRATGGIRYRWYRNDTALALPVGDTLQARVGGRYRVELFHPEGCRRLLPGWVDLTHIARPRLGFDVRGVCSEVPVTFVNRSVAPAVGQVAWQWRFGDGATDTRDSVEHIYRDTGIYRVQLTYRNGHCPQHADTLTRLLPLVRLPDIRYRDVLTVPDHPTELRARDTGVRFLWVPAGLLSDARLRNPLASLKETSTFVVRIAFGNGCVVFDTVEVKVARQPGIHVPKAFTPNGDGRNDRLRPILVGISELRYFRVYNRWGNLLHESRGAVSELGWDGIFRGLPQPMDTYVWTAAATDVRGNPIRAGGNTLLMR
jgi:gliding motility-associated-like protein